MAREGPAPVLPHGRSGLQRALELRHSARRAGKPSPAGLCSCSGQLWNHHQDNCPLLQLGELRSGAACSWPAG